MVMKNKNRHAGIWIMVVAAVVLEGITAMQYFTSRAATRHEVELRAKAELRKAELEIELHTVEMETAAKTLALLAEKNLNNPDSIYAATRLAVSTLRNNTSMAVAYVPDYFPKYGRFFEACSSRFSEDSIYTRQIGSAEHDYTKMEWFQNGLTIDSCWWCEPYLDDSGSQAYVVSCSCPIKNPKDEVVAVVCIDLSLNDLKNLSDYLQVYPNSYYTIHSGDGTAIVPAPDTVPGRKYSIYTKEIGATGWHIEIIIPEDVLFADINRVGRIVTLLMLIGLAILALILIYTARAIRKMLLLAEQNNRMEGELVIAQTIQNAMLPKVFPPFVDRPDVNLYGMVQPAKEIGGDLYDFYVRHDKLFFCVGDVSGKGVPASLIMATIRSLFRSTTAHEENPAHIAMEINNAISEQNDENMFVTLFIGVLDLNSGVLDYCNAGHNAPVSMSKDGCSMIEVLPNLPIGVMNGFTYQAQQMKMNRSDKLFLYTDGLTEAENERHDQYGEQRMIDNLTAMNDLRPHEIVGRMEKSVKEFAGEAPQSDDLTMLAIRYQTPAIVMRNDIQQIPTLAEWIDDLKLPQALNMPINLALEEAVTNVMMYAYPGRNDGQVFVEYTEAESDKGKKLIFTISDSGIPFDPTQKAEVDTSLPAEEREIGGLGIHLVRQLMDEVRYDRDEGKNILTLVKNI